MNRLFIGLGTSACIAFLGWSNIAVAANGSVAASMAKDFWISSKKNQERIAAQAATRVAVTEAPPPAPVTRPRADNPRPAR